jgi:S-DNA-T family DNA segregation ATPase FtsK/SpoIIIE
MQIDDIKAWRNTNLVLDLLGKVWRLARRHWVVSIPFGTWVLAGLVFQNDVISVLVVGIVTYFCVKKWKAQRAVAQVGHADAIQAYGSAENLARVQYYRGTWPEVARNSGLTKRKESFGLGTFGAAREALRSATPTAKLDAMRKGSPLDDLEVPVLLDVRPSPLGLTLEVAMLAGQGLATYARAAEVIGHQWDVESVRVSLARPGVVEITPVTKNPLADVIEITPDTVPVMESLKAVQVGVQENGLPWMMPIDQSHTVGGGVPGSGKSVFGNVLLAGMAPRVDIQIVGIDCAGGVELSDWQPRFSEFATNQEQAIDVLTALWSEHERRIIWLREHGYKSVSNAGYSETMPLWICLIDEAAQLFRLDSSNKEEKARGQQLNDLVTRLVTVSRKTGIVVVLLTQRPMSSVISTNIRDNMPHKVCFRVMTPESATAVLGDAASYAPMSPTEIKREQKGVAIAEDEDGDLTVVRSFFITEESDRAIARQYAHLARRLPRQHEDGIVDAEIIG